MLGHRSRPDGGGFYSQLINEAVDGFREAEGKVLVRSLSAMLGEDDGAEDQGAAEQEEEKAAAKTKGPKSVVSRIVDEEEDEEETADPVEWDDADQSDEEV